LGRKAIKVIKAIRAIKVIKAKKINIACPEWAPLGSEVEGREKAGSDLRQQ